MEGWIGRTKEDSIEIKPIALGSHSFFVSSVFTLGAFVGVLGLLEAEADERRIVRHSLPYGTATGDAGLFFIAYSKTPKTLDWMLDRMVGHTADKATDGLFNFTTPLTGAYFYVPSKAELQDIFKKCSKY
ncbi:unnamed protein product [Dibothriocephalus latus]|uniref:Dyp-type peroxidase C-terminal domain-containing protein n=1 Tax=Dibothriocephalus latus TaxID=60516 RepID=A0A3P6RPC5_DIBLA|nr:unnamed protein product [Dibothriocephalus latus]